MKNLLLTITTAAIALLTATVISQAIILKAVPVVGIVLIVGLCEVWKIAYKEYKEARR